SAQDPHFEQFRLRESRREFSLSNERIKIAPTNENLAPYPDQSSLYRAAALRPVRTGGVPASAVAGADRGGRSGCQRGDAPGCGAMDHASGLLRRRYPLV